MPFYTVTTVTLSRLNSINAIDVAGYGYHWNIFGISLEYLWNTFGISLEYLLSERTSRVSPVSFSSARSSRIDNGLLYIYPRDATSQIFTQFIGAIDVACVTLCHNINIINVTGPQEANNSVFKLFSNNCDQIVFVFG